VSALLLLLTACAVESPRPETGSSTAGVPRAERPAPLPAGRRLYDGSGYRFDYPSSWRPVDPPLSPGASAQFLAPKAEAPLPPSLAAFRAEGFRDTFESYVNVVDYDRAGVPGYRALAREPLSPRGARDGRLLVSEYTQYHRDGRPISPDDVTDGDPGVMGLKVRQWDALVLAPGGVTVAVRLAAPAQVFPRYEREFRRIVDSLEIVA